MQRRVLGLFAFSLAVMLGRPASADFISGVVYAPASELNQVIQVNPDGTWNTALNVLDIPWGLAFRNQDELYVTGTGPNWPSPSGQMIGYRSDGSVFLTVPNVPVTNGFVNGSAGTGLAIDSQGNAYIATWNTPGATKLTNGGGVSDWTGYQSGLWWGRAAAFSPSGQLYMIQGLDYGSNPTSTLATINTVTGAVNFVQQNLPLLNGLAIDSQGNIYLSETLQNEIVKIAAGTGTITAFASLADAGPLTIGPDGRLYAAGAAQNGTDQIWSYNLSTGGASLYASNLPALSDIAFAPGTGVPDYSGPPVAIVASAVPEPSTVLMMLIGLPISLFYGSRWKRSTMEEVDEGTQPEKRE